MTDEHIEKRTMKFEDKGALDTYIAMSGLADEDATELREKVEKFGYGTPVPVPEEPENDEE